MSARVTCIAAALMSAALVGPAQSAEPKLPRDGWVSWDVPAVENAPAWCCFGWKNNNAGAPRSCKLDSHANNFGSHDHETTDTMTVYARTVAGKLDRVHVFSASCPVEANTPIQELTDVTPDDSARWLLAQVSADASSRRQIGENALAALSMHRGDFARDSLVRIGTADKTAELRTKAWFWLAMSGAPGAEAPISSAVRKDPDDEVREQAVFALSRLPDERAIKALIGVAEDRSLSREERKRAVFWLSQSESTAALAYLDKVLARTETRQ
jgi:hypothetical protein